MARLKDKKPGVPEIGNASILEQRKAIKALEIAKKLEKQRLKAGYKYMITGDKTRKLIKP